MWMCIVIKLVSVCMNDYIVPYLLFMNIIIAIYIYVDYS